jgi:D-sedoheptulose 7-phosphate isomerase
MIFRAVASQYLKDLESVLHQVDFAALERVVECLRNARDRGAMMFVAGNGGSSATASHWVNDLNKATKRSGQRALRAVCLTDSTPWLTALANDEGFERVFVGQLENFAQANDVLIVISASGNSLNLVKAVDFARVKGVLTIGFLGFDGGALKRMVDECVWVPSEVGAYGLVESAHTVLCDIVTTCLIHDQRQ